MDQKRALIVIGVIILVLMGIVLGIAYYSGRAARQNNPITTPSDNLVNINNPSRSPLPGLPSPSPFILSTPAASPTPAPVQNTGGLGSNIQIYSGQGFSLNYPAAWGLLTCNNSQNFELDPYSNIDQPNTTCDIAQKPVTIMVANQNLSCPGESVRIGNNTVIRSKVTKDNGDINYRWCVKGSNRTLDITHRVSNRNVRARSKDDFSGRVEDIIKTISFNTGS